MGGLVGEPDDLVLDGGAVARPHPLNHPGEQRRPVQIGADDLVCRQVGVDQVAGQLGPPRSRLELRVDRIGRREPGVVLPASQEAEIERRLAARLGHGPAEVDGPGVNARRRARLQPPQSEAQPPQALRQPGGGRFPGPAPLVGGVPDDDPAPQRGARGQNDGLPLEDLPQAGPDPQPRRSALPARCPGPPPGPASDPGSACLSRVCFMARL